jgi:hypothetical protein
MCFNHIEMNAFKWLTGIPRRSTTLKLGKLRMHVQVGAGSFFKLIITQQASEKDLRYGSLSDAEIKPWLYHEGIFSIPESVADAENANGGFRILFCENPSPRRLCFGLSKERFELVESIFGLHPVTLSAIAVYGGTFSKHIQSNPQKSSKIDKISMYA